MSGLGIVWVQWILVTAPILIGALALLATAGAWALAFRIYTLYRGMVADAELGQAPGRHAKPPEAAAAEADPPPVAVIRLPERVRRWREDPFADVDYSTLPKPGDGVHEDTVVWASGRPPEGPCPFCFAPICSRCLGCSCSTGTCECTQTAGAIGSVR